MYYVVENEGKYEIHIKGLEDLNFRPIVVLDDLEFAEKYCDNLNTSYEIGYKHGAELGY